MPKVLCDKMKTHPSIHHLTVVVDPTQRAKDLLPEGMKATGSPPTSENN